MKDDITAEAFQRLAEELARQVRTGTNIMPKTGRLRRLPRLVAWLLTTNQSHEGLTAALDSMADAYHDRTQRMGDLLRVYLPIWLTLFIGGGVTIVYVLSLSIPWLATLSEFAHF